MACKKYDGPGRPLKFKSVEELEKKIDKYFKSCYKAVKDDEGNIVYENIRPLTISGLALELDVDRRTLLNYEDKEQYFLTIRKAKARIEAFAEESLWKPKIATGIAFNLKNNFGWVDRQEIQADVNQNVIKVEPPKFDDEE